MRLSRTELKALRDYPERFDTDGDGPDGTKYGLWTRLNTENCSKQHPEPHSDCSCAGRVFSITADDAASFHQTVLEMECCQCCGSWYQEGT